MAPRSPLAEGGLSIRVFLLAEGNIGHANSRIVDVCLAVGPVVWGGMAVFELVWHWEDGKEGDERQQRDGGGLKWYGKKKNSNQGHEERAAV